MQQHDHCSCRHRRPRPGHVHHCCSHPCVHHYCHPYPLPDPRRRRHHHCRIEVVIIIVFPPPRPHHRHHRHHHHHHRRRRRRRRRRHSRHDCCRYRDPHHRISVLLSSSVFAVVNVRHVSESRIAAISIARQPDSTQGNLPEPYAVNI